MGNSCCASSRNIGKSSKGRKNAPTILDSDDGDLRDGSVRL